MEFEGRLPVGYSFVAVRKWDAKADWPAWQGAYEVQVREPRFGMVVFARGKSVDAAVDAIVREAARR